MFEILTSLIQQPLKKWRNHVLLSKKIIALTGNDENEIQIKQLLLEGANPNQKANRPNEKTSHTLLNLALGVGAFNVANNLLKVGAHPDQETVEILARSAQTYKQFQWDYNAYQESSLFSTSQKRPTAPIASLGLTVKNPGIWEGADTAFLCLKNIPLNWWNVYSYGNLLSEAACKTIEGASPGFLLALDRNNETMGWTRGRPQLPDLSNHELNKLLIETVEGGGEKLDTLERKERLHILLEKGGNPNALCSNKIYGKDVTLTDMAMYKWQPDILDILLKYGGKIQNQGFLFLAQETIIFMKSEIALNIDAMPENIEKIKATKQQRLIEAMTLMENHTEIDWLSDTIFSETVMQQNSAGNIIASSHKISLINALAEHFPAFEAKRIHLRLEAETATPKHKMLDERKRLNSRL